MAHLIWRLGSGDQVLLLRERHSLGRHPDNDIQVLDTLASKRHCELERRDGGWILRDLGSLNGTWVNGERLQGERRLLHLDQVTIGGTSLVFSDLEEAMRDAPDPGPPARVVIGPDRAALQPALEATCIVEHPQPPISVRIPREVERQIVVADRFEQAIAHALAAEDRGALLRKALEDVLDLLEGQWGAAFLAPISVDARPWSVAARGGAPPDDRSVSPALIAEALERRRPVARIRTEPLGPRVWKPVCQIAVPVAHADSVVALLYVEREGSDEGLPLSKTELLAMVVGALAARVGESKRVLH